MHTEAISDSLWGLLQRLNEMPFVRSCYLGGGTALALQLGHRISDDLDLFSPQTLDQNTWLRDITDAGLDAIVVNQTQNHMELAIGAVKVDMIREQIPLLFPTKPIHSQLANLEMADSRDIGRMKLIAIGSRGSKKDFVDLYCLTRENTSLESLLTATMKPKEGIRYNKLLFLKGLIDFEEADREPELSMIWNISWEEIKGSLRVEVKQTAEKMEG